jgi:serine protease Do
VKIVRDKQPRTVNVVVGELNLDQEAATQDEESEDLSQGFGLTLEDVTPALARRLRLPPGTTGAVVVAVRPRGPADRAAIREGDVIVRVGRNEIEDSDAAARELQRVQAGRAVGIYLLRQGQEIFVTMRKE